MNFRVTLAYDGTDFCGWQAQLNQPTIQGVLNEVLNKLEGGYVKIQVAGRTDAGVHAEGQVISFQMTEEWEGKNLLRAINGNLPQQIRVLEAAAVSDDFHARFDTKSKTYRYQLYNAEVMNPFLARYAWHYPYQLDTQCIFEESRSLVGRHDFTVFTVAECDAKTRVRTMTDIRLEKAGDLVQIFFTGDGFLRYQVRTMVSALLEVNRGRLKTGSIEELIASGNRALTGAPAPARGLTLMKVEY